MGWLYIVKAYVLVAAIRHENELPSGAYQFVTVYEGSEETEAIAAWKKAKADGAGCVVIEDRS